MALSIKNEFLSASFKEKGAELCSLQSNTSGREYIWQAEPVFWNRHAPVLFPFVGKLKDGLYEYDGQQYAMGQHGFARDQMFEVTRHQADAISFELSATPESLRIYPFQFKLRIHYALSGNTLHTKYEVVNMDNKTMYFSIGAHPAFNCPIDEKYHREDYHLQFDKDENTEIHYLENGLLGNSTEAFTGNQIQLTQKVFDRDALIFKDYKSTKITLNDPERKVLEMVFEGFPYLGIWSKNRESPFVCIEPWFGVADSHAHDHKLENKEGILTLEPNKTFDCGFEVNIA